MAETNAAVPEISDLRAMLEPPSTQKVEPVEQHSETPKVEQAKADEPAAEPGDKKLEPEASEKEEPLPEAVTKRIAKESERQAKIQGEIARAVSARKAAEHELEKEQALAAKGSQPVKPAQAADARPIKPILDDFKTYAEYQTASTKYEADHDSWLIGETRKTFAQESSAREQQAAHKTAWDSAVKEHGAEFPTLVKTVTDQTSEGFQTAVSQLEDWPRVAVHLAKNQAELTEIAGLFERNPYQAVAKLGQLQAKLQPAPKTAAAAETLPEPPKKVGGAAAATGSTDLSDGRISFSAFKAGVEKLKLKR